MIPTPNIPLQEARKLADALTILLTNPGHGREIAQEALNEFDKFDNEVIEREKTGVIGDFQ